MLLVAVPQPEDLAGLAHGATSEVIAIGATEPDVDTLAWIQWLINSRLGLVPAVDFPVSREWLVPTAVQLELARWLTREVGDDKADQVIASSQVRGRPSRHIHCAIGGGTERQVQARHGRCHHLYDRAGPWRRPADV
jgi:hypothetical protein